MRLDLTETITMRKLKTLSFFVICCVPWFIQNTICAQEQTIVLKASKQMIRKIGLPIVDSGQLKNSTLNSLGSGAQEEIVERAIGFMFVENKGAYNKEVQNNAKLYKRYRKLSNTK